LPETVPAPQIIVSSVAKKIQDLLTWQACRYRIVSANGQ